MIINNLNGLLETIRDDKAKVISGLKQQDQDRNYKTPVVIAILEPSFALVDASIMTVIETQRDNHEFTDS
jgi:hypothetical protein